MTLSLKSFNKHIESRHFKMDSVWTAIRLMTPACYLVPQVPQIWIGQHSIEIYVSALEHLRS